jgi:predicted CopG family antitoxin
MKYIPILVDPETHRRLKLIGKKGESFNDIVKRLLEAYEKSEGKKNVGER